MKTGAQERALVGFTMQELCTPHFRLMLMEGEHLLFYHLSPAPQTVKYLNLLKGFYPRNRPLVLLLCASQPFCPQTFLSWGLLSVVLL